MVPNTLVAILGATCTLSSVNKFEVRGIQLIDCD